MPVTTIYLSTTNGRVGSHLVWGMISTDFFYFFTVFGFFGYFLCFLFFLGTMLLFVWLYIYIYIFKCFWSQTSQGTREWLIPPPFLIGELSVLNRLKKLFMVIRKACEFRTTLPPGRFWPIKGVNVSIRSARSARQRFCRS